MHCSRSGWLSYAISALIVPILQVVAAVTNSKAAAVAVLLANALTTLLGLWGLRVETPEGKRLSKSASLAAALSTGSLALDLYLFISQKQIISFRQGDYSSVENNVAVFTAAILLSSAAAAVGMLALFYDCVKH